MFRITKAQVLFALRIVGAGVPALIVATLLGGLQAGVISLFASAFVILGDGGGTYRQRAVSMLLITILCTTSVIFATLVVSVPWLIVPTILVWVFGLSMLGAYGTRGAKMGLVAANAFLFMLGMGGTPQQLPMRVLLFVASGLWGTALSLCVWPWRPQQPALDAVSEYYRALKVFVTKACDPRVGNVGIGSRWVEAAKRERSAVLAASEKAHAFVQQDATQQPLIEGDTEQQLALLTLNADYLLDKCITLSADIERVSTQEDFAQVRETLEVAVGHVVEALDVMVLMIKGRKVAGEQDFQHTLHVLRMCEKQLQDRLSLLEREYAALLSLRSIIRVLENMAVILQSSHEVAQQLAVQKVRTRGSGKWWSIDRLYVMQLWAEMKEHLTLRSAVFRHALRVSLATSVAFALYQLLSIPFGYWIALSVFLMLRSDYSLTRQRVLYRLWGTSIGAVLSVLLVTAIHNQTILLALLVLFVMVSFVHVSGHYGVYTVYLTLFSVLLIEVSRHMDWHVALIRIVDTFIGCVIAFLAGYYLWPMWERERLPKQLANAIAANRHFLNVALTMPGTVSSKDELYEAGKRARKENKEVAAALQRLLQEPKRKRGEVEPYSTLIMYSQRVCDSITILSEYLPSIYTVNTPNMPYQFMHDINVLLERLEDAVSHNVPLELDFSVDDWLQDMQASLQQFVQVHVGRLRNEESGDVQISVWDYAIVGAQLDRVLHDVSKMLVSK